MVRLQFKDKQRAWNGLLEKWGVCKLNYGDHWHPLTWTSDDKKHVVEFRRKDGRLSWKDQNPILFNEIKEWPENTFKY